MRAAITARAHQVSAAMGKQICRTSGSNSVTELFPNVDKPFLQFPAANPVLGKSIRYIPVSDLRLHPFYLLRLAPT